MTIEALSLAMHNSEAFWIGVLVLVWVVSGAAVVRGIRG